MSCKICGLNEAGVLYTILGATPPRVFRPFVTVCQICMDTCPCGSVETWQDGKLTCSHGTIFEVDGNPPPPSMHFRRVGLTFWARLKNIFVRGYRPCGE